MLTPRSIALPAAFALLVTPLALTTVHGAQPRLPAGSQLMSSMLATMFANRSYHVQGSIQALGPTGQDTVSLTGDISTRTQQGRVVATVQGPGAGFGIPASVRAVVVGRRLALKEGGNAWQCQSGSSPMQLLTGYIGSPQVARARTRGASVVNGTAVWLVQAPTGIQLLGQPAHVKATYAIAQSDHRLLRVTSHNFLHIAGLQVRERINVAFTRFGETVTATLPAACR